MTTVQSDAPSQVLFCGGELSAVAHPSIQKEHLGAQRLVEPPRTPRRSAINAMREAYAARYTRGNFPLGALGADARRPSINAHAV